MNNLKVLIVTTGTQDFILNTFLYSLRTKGGYEGDVLILDYEDTKGSFTKENLAKLLLDKNIIYSRTKKIYSTFTADRFRAFTIFLENIWNKYDVIMHIDGNDIEFMNPIKPLLEKGKESLVCFLEEALNGQYVVCNSNKGWKTGDTLPIDYIMAIKDKQVINAGMFLGPSYTVYALIKAIGKYVECDNRFGSDQLIFNSLIYYNNIPFTVVNDEWDCFCDRFSKSFTKRDNKIWFKDRNNIEKEVNIMHYVGKGEYKNLIKNKEDLKDSLKEGNDCRVTIVVATMDIHSDRTKRCVEAIRNNTTIPYQLVVVESHLQEDIYNHCRDMNIIMKNLDFDYYIHCNDDLYVKPYWLEALIETVKQDNKIGVVGGLYFTLDGRIQHAGGRLNFIEDKVENWGKVGVGHRFHFSEGVPVNMEDVYKQQDCIFVTGALILITNKCLRTIGMLDERLKLSLGDIEYCLRAWENGFRVVYQPKCQAIHEGSVSVNSVGGWDKPYSYASKILKNRWDTKSFDRIKNIVLKSNKTNYEYPPVIPLMTTSPIIITEVKENVVKIPIEDKKLSYSEWYRKYKFPC